MFLSPRERFRFEAIVRAVKEWNFVFAPIPFYRIPTGHEIEFLSGQSIVSRNEILTATKEVLQYGNL